MYYSYTPKYSDLDYLYERYIVPRNDTRLNFFFDVKNGIYVPEHEVLNEENKLEQAVEFISAIINVIQYIKNRFSQSFDIKDRLRFYFFCESGKSSYHRGIDMNYKSNRGINDYLIRSERDEILSKTTFFAINTLKEIINMIPGAYFFLGEYKEMDHIPYVVFKEKFQENDVGVIFSTDKDMYQLNSYTSNFEQLEKMTFVSKWHPGRLFINKDNYIDRFLFRDYPDGVDVEMKKWIHNNFSLLRAIVGDSGDGVLGLKGIGNKTLIKLMKKFDLMNVFLPRDFYNQKLYNLDFQKFDFKNENIIFDLEKIKTFEKEIKKSKKLDLLFDPESIERISKNLALMDYDIMYHRRRLNDKDFIDSVLKNDIKFKSEKEIETFINNTNLWNNFSYNRITITL